MRRPRTVLLASIALALVSLVSCGPTSIDCERDYYNCPGGFGGRALAGGAGQSGQAGEGGEAGRGGSNTAGGGGAGAVGTGGNPAAGGQNGGNSGEAGADLAGAAGSAPCNGACGGAKAVCDAPSNTCVECADDSTCSSPKPACDVPAKACVGCTQDKHCSGAKALCDTKAEVCVACLTDTDCKDPTAARCDAGVCKPCSDKSQCAHIAGKGVCDLGPGQCVQCTGGDYAACGKDTATQTALVCDSLKKTCSANKEHDAGLCIPCVSDANCTLGQMCVLQKFKNANVGYFCAWKQGDVANNAPADCFATGQPYFGTINGAESIDGQIADICTLRASTCLARNQFSNKDCAPTAVPNDSLCGFAPPDDAKCAKVSATVYRCTMRCIGNDDCPGTTCATGLAPPVCNLQ